MIESVLNDVMKAASFQFLSFNKDNSQYFVDVDKATAVDDLIQNRGEELNGGSLDRYYFQVLNKPQKFLILHISMDIRFGFMKFHGKLDV